MCAGRGNRTGTPTLAMTSTLHLCVSCRAISMLLCVCLLSLCVRACVRDKVSAHAMRVPIVTMCTCLCARQGICACYACAHCHYVRVPMCAPRYLCTLMATRVDTHAPQRQCAIPCARSPASAIAMLHDRLEPALPFSPYGACAMRVACRRTPSLPPSHPAQMGDGADASQGDTAPAAPEFDEPLLQPEISSDC